MKTYSMEVVDITPAAMEVAEDLSHSDKAIREKSIVHAKDRMRFACDVEATSIVITPGKGGRSKLLQSYDAEWKPEYGSKLAEARKAATRKGEDPRLATVPPEFVMETVNRDYTAHMADFLGCIRSRGLPVCGVDRAFEEAVAIVMSVAAFKQNRKVRWDPVREEIV